jgi:catechol-2,3-dioxygenase
MLVTVETEWSKIRVRSAASLQTFYQRVLVRKRKTKCHRSSTEMNFPFNDLKTMDLNQSKMKMQRMPEETEKIKTEFVG